MEHRKKHTHTHTFIQIDVTIIASAAGYNNRSYDALNFLNKFHFNVVTNQVIALSL